jgi:hypothetical protein
LRSGVLFLIAALRLPLVLLEVVDVTQRFINHHSVELLPIDHRGSERVPLRGGLSLGRVIRVLMPLHRRLLPHYLLLEDVELKIGLFFFLFGNLGVVIAYILTLHVPGYGLGKVGVHSR